MTSLRSCLIGNSSCVVLQLAHKLWRPTNLDRVWVPGIPRLEVSDDRHRVPLPSPLKSSFLCLYLVFVLLSAADLLKAVTIARP